MRLASIDIGTNTVLLLVVEISPHPNPLPRGEREIRVLRDEARITRLGEGLHRKPQFIPRAELRTLKALKEYRKICNSLKVEKIIAVGTAAFRKAKNAEKFVARVKKETGIEIKIISGNREAELSYLSVKNDFGKYKNLVALDIGGGSTEIISSKRAVSLNLGGVVLTERIIRHDPPTEKEAAALESEIDQVINRWGAGGRAGSSPTLIGLAGSVTTLSAIKQKLKIWDGARVQGSVLTMADLEKQLKLFRKTTVAQKSKIPGMVKGREDTILAGTLILKKVMEKLGVKKVTVSDRGLRYGLFYPA
jgi:exopolyphosphatase/guanosine-5'-triphosphate,3'-diphosphate pyrophosphatase